MITATTNKNSNLKAFQLLNALDIAQQNYDFNADLKNGILLKIAKMDLINYYLKG
jgi:hypothetical protein